MNTMTYNKVDRDILAATALPGRAYLLTLAVVASFIFVGGLAFLYQVYYGLGVAGYAHSMRWTQNVHFSITPLVRTVTSGFSCRFRGSAHW